AEGIGEVYLAKVDSFTVSDPRAIGYDAAIEFPPLGFRLLTFDNRLLQLRDRNFRGTIHHYPSMVDYAMQKPLFEHVYLRGIFPGWDNTPRVRERARLFAESRPAEYQRWLRFLV